MGIIKPKPTDLSHVPGLVFATNCIPSPDGVLVDISGNGNNGTITGAVSSENGLITNISRGSISISPVINMAVATYALRMTPTDFSLNGHILSAGVTTITYIRFDTDGKIRIEGSTGGDSDTFDFTFVVGNTYNIVITVNSSFLWQLYVNGVLEDSFTLSTNVMTGLTTIGGSSSTRRLGAEFADLRIFNYAFSEQEAQEYHNSFQKLEKKGTFTADFGVGQDEISLSGHIVFNSGEFSVRELSAQDGDVPALDKGTKYLLCDSGGSFKIPYTKTTSVDALFYYYDGANWAEKDDTLANHITNESWLSQPGDYLVFTFSAGDAIILDYIKNLIVQ